MKTIAIVLPSILPVPVVKGGAIETLVNSLINENEKNINLNITVFSVWNKLAVKKSECYKNSDFVWLNSNLNYKILDFIIRIVRKFSKKILPYDIYFINNYLKKKSFDVIIVEGNSRHAAQLKQINLKNNIFFHIHSDLFGSRDKYLSQAISNCDKVIVISNYLKKRVISNSTIAHDKIIIFRNCTDIELFNNRRSMLDNIDLRIKFKIPSSSIVILFTGRLVENKGIGVLIESILDLDQNLDYYLIIVGSAGSKFGVMTKRKDSFYERLIQSVSPIKERVLFTGFVHNSLITDFHKISDIAVVPSLCEEAAGLVAIEAMASGLPLIATNSGGLPEYVNPNCAIIINKDHNLIQNLKSALENLIIDQDLRISMGDAGYKNAQKYSIKNYYNEFNKIIQHC